MVDVILNGILSRNRVQNWLKLAYHVWTQIEETNYGLNCQALLEIEAQ